MKKLVLLCGALALLALGVRAQTPEYTAKMTRMLELSGSDAVMKELPKQMIGMMKQQSPSVSEATWNAVTEKAKKFFSDNLVKVYVPIYQKHLTLDDLKKIVAFYESPAGKKLGAVTPAITMEGMTAGQQLGMELVTLIQRELDAHGNK